MTNFLKFAHSMYCWPGKMRGARLSENAILIERIRQIHIWGLCFWIRGAVVGSQKSRKTRWDVPHNNPSFKDVHTYRYCFYMFINGGYFFESSTLGLNMLIARCGMISGSYAILLSHFLYRYLVVRNAFISAHFKLYMLGTVMMFIFFFVYWYGVSECLVNFLITG